MSRAFILAIALHAAGAVLLGAAIRYWPGVAPPTPPGQLELDVAAAPPPAPLKGVTEPPAWEQALASVPAEMRSGMAPAAPIPEARATSAPEPSVTVSPVGEFRGPVKPAMSREDMWVVAAPPAPGLSSVVAQPGNGGGSPTALSEIRPHYPYTARTRGEEGKVTVRVHVTERGQVDSASVGEGSGFSALDESALSAARKARFKPAEQDGKPVPSEMNLHFDFRLQDE